jgi:hypothetical protein
MQLSREKVETKKYHLGENVNGLIAEKTAFPGMAYGEIVPAGMVLVVSAHPEMANLPDIGVARKI